MLPLAPFKLERYFARYEFTTRCLISASDCESMRLPELLEMADADGRRRWEALWLGYTESQGDPALRAAIVAQYTALAPDDILTLAPEEGILIAMHASLRAGDHVVVMQPAYQSLSEVARALGCQVTAWPVRPDASGAAWRLDVDELAGLLRPETRLLVINFPHNPTGYLPPRADLQAILALADRRGLVVFSDEMYRYLEASPGERLPPVCDLYERGISLSGLSKAYGLPGLRLGWLATRLPGFIERCLMLKDYTTICSSAPSEVLGLIAVRAADRITARNRAIIISNLTLADEFFRRWPAQFEWPPPMAGPIAFPAWRGPGGVDGLCQAALEQEALMVVPAAMFDYAGERFRLGLGRRNFPDALARLEAVVARLCA